MHHVMQLDSVHVAGLLRRQTKSFSEKKLTKANPERGWLFLLSYFLEIF